MKPAILRPFLPRPALRRRIWISRSYAVQAPGNPTLQIFDRHTKYLQKERAAADVKRSRQVDYLKDEVAMRLSERLLVSFNILIGA
jgi:NADH dehydrogenase [ubiquinone] 1 alpha subcomplex assembly factor 5